LIKLTNKGIISRNITARLTSVDPSIELPAAVYGIKILEDEYDKISNDLVIPCSFSVRTGAVGHLANLKLHLTADNNYTTVVSFDVKIGSPNVLLVDDDDGANYEQYFDQPMSLARIYSDKWEVKSSGIPAFADVLQNYQTVIWFTGDDRTSSLTREEQQAISAYLDQGGWLVLTGQDIGYDLIADGTPGDSSFYANYLHAELVSDSVKSTRVRGEVGDPIANGLFIYFEDKPGSAGNQRSPSSIAPREGASSFLRYIPQNSTAGIRYMDDQKGYRLVYLAFGFEGISGPYQDSAQQLLNRIFSWFSGETGMDQLKFENVPKKYELEQNYPNPFNPTTMIRYHLPRSDRVELDIFNLRGQKIKTLVDESQTAGVYELIWDGRDDFGLPVASGIYVYRLVTKFFVSSQKLALIK
jgi:hypothetical protein